MGDHADYYSTLFLFTGHITLTMKLASNLGGIVSSCKIYFPRMLFLFIYLFLNIICATCHSRLAYLDVATCGDQKRIISGEVQVCHPASMERVHAVFTISGADFQQGAVPDAPELQGTIKTTKMRVLYRRQSWQYKTRACNPPSCHGNSFKSRTF